MKILFCSPLPLSKEVGTSKILVELAEAMTDLGWDCHLQDPYDLCSDLKHIEITSYEYRHLYRQSLYQHLQKYAHKYDVVDYDRLYLPYPRTEFSSTTLMVARSALLIHHLEHHPIPIANTLRGKVGHLLKGARRRAELLRDIDLSTKTIQQADLVNVSTEDDRAELIRRGISGEKIIAIPYGISQERRLYFNQVSSEIPEPPIVTFVGTFDLRKGANEMPDIVRRILRAIPNAQFRLLGSANFQDQEKLLKQFAIDIRDRIQVVLSYKAEELPNLLSSCSVGIFPSYLEGFPFGILEMLAASVPVVAYQAPGANAMLSGKDLIPCGDASGISDRVIELLTDSRQLYQSRISARQRSELFSWEYVAKTTDEIYQKFLASKLTTSTI